MAGHNRKAISGTAVIPIGSGGDEIVASIVFEVSSQSSLSMKPQINLDGAGTTPVDVTYLNVATGAIVAAGTPITADGVYAVYVPACQLSVVASAGTCNLDWAVVFGRVG